MRLRASAAGLVLPRLLAAMLLALLPFGPAGCDRDGGGGGGGGSSSTTGDIAIGHFASMTGDTATFGVSADEGIRLAMNEINGSGGTWLPSSAACSA